MFDLYYVKSYYLILDFEYTVNKSFSTFSIYNYFNVVNFFSFSAVNDASEYAPGIFDESSNLAICIVSPPNPLTLIP